MPANKNTNFASIGATDACALRYPSLSNVSHPGNVTPDTGDSGLVIPLRLTSYSGLTSKPTTSSVDIIPIINPNDGGFAIGGKTISYSSMELPKIHIEGYADTPCTATTVSGELLNIPQAIFNSMNVTYADLITAYMEGRANLQTVNTGGITLDNMWTRTNPTWFRDPFGRVYNNPKVISFNASYVEQYPGRTTFQMILQVPPQ